MLTFTKIVANQIFNQNWQLPLALDKEHLNDVQLLKKMKAKTNQQADPTDEDKEIEVEELEEGDELISLGAVQQRMAERKGQNSNCLPSMTAVRNARHLISMETEKKSF